MITHCALQIQWTGGLWSSDSARFEFSHKFTVKDPYKVPISFDLIRFDFIAFDLISFDFIHVCPFF
jgi:hypothetical protein